MTFFRFASLLFPVALLWSATGVSATQPLDLPGWQIGPFVRPLSAQPVIRPDKLASFIDPTSGKAVRWEALHTFNPAAVVRGGKVFVLYRAEDDSGAMGIGLHTSRLGLAVSDDGLHFTAEPAPVFFAANDEQAGREQPGGVEDPRIVEREDGTYAITYTQWNRKTYSIGLATSTDLHHWTKWGPVFGSTGKYGTMQYKSGSILTKLRGGQLLAAKINGKYWMYWGEGHVSLATSPDLIHWTPVEDAKGKPVVLLSPRPGHFDSGLPEVGPPALVTSRGIVLVYNGKNAEGNGKTADGKSAARTNVTDGTGAPDLKAGTYSVGEALFDPADPAHLLARTATPIFRPQEAFEQSGQYAAGTTFAEGLVPFKGKWFLYYGCADSFVAVATADWQDGPSAASPQR